VSIVPPGAINPLLAVPCTGCAWCSPRPAFMPDLVRNTVAFRGPAYRPAALLSEASPCRRNPHAPRSRPGPRHHAARLPSPSRRRLGAAAIAADAGAIRCVSFLRRSFPALPDRPPSGGRCALPARVFAALLGGRFRAAGALAGPLPRPLLLRPSRPLPAAFCGWV
jgi:hypothetical protein